MSVFGRLVAAVSHRKADPEDVLARCSFDSVVDVKKGEGFRRCRRPAEVDGRCWQHLETSKPAATSLPLFGGGDD